MRKCQFTKTSIKDLEVICGALFPKWKTLIQQSLSVKGKNRRVSCINICLCLIVQVEEKNKEILPRLMAATSNINGFYQRGKVVPKVTELKGKRNRRRVWFYWVMSSLQKLETLSKLVSWGSSLCFTAAIQSPSYPQWTGFPSFFGCLRGSLCIFHKHELYSCCANN